MCGRYGYTKKSGDNLRTRFSVEPPMHDWNSYNIAPTQPALTIVGESPHRKVQQLKFGIEAGWKPGMQLINAKAETVDELRTFKSLFEQHRCLVIADVFYEWKRDGKDKIPYAFALNDNEDFAFAGIYREKEGFVILTTTPNKTMSDVHNRMPVILRKEDEEVWLNPDTPVNQLLALLKPYPDTLMKKWPISSLVNKPQNNFPELLKPASI